MINEFYAKTPIDTFAIGERIAETLIGGEVILVYGGLGAGKTLFTKGVMNGIEFEVDEVTSPSFSLVNLYQAKAFDVYHLDLWLLDAASNPAEAVGLGEILENDKAVTIIEWADRLGNFPIANRVITVEIEGDGDEPRKLKIERLARPVE